MHLQQTKRASRTTGGPQYYLHSVPEDKAHFLSRKKAVPVALVTPYGATPSTFKAVSKDAKLGPNGTVLPGHVGHDRIQQAEAGESIGEAIRRWYRLSSGDFERIDVETDIIDAKFYLSPTGYKYAGQSRRREIQKPEFPLSFNERRQSELWRRQLDRLKSNRLEMWQWSADEICRIASVHLKKGVTAFIREEDLLRASGPLSILGLECGPYVGKGIDCEATFRFLDYEPYAVPIEIKKLSSHFKYQQKKYSPEQLSRVVILCARHDLKNVPVNVDVIELGALCEAMR
jgi:hypothetical protein